jgi:FAD/FMN-containing dehydrogenase
MKALVVYESFFGNTEQVAQAIARGLSEHGEVEVVEVSKAPAELTEPVDLIVIGGPTHAFSMTRESTRQDARRRGATRGSTAVGVREWLEHLQRGRHAELVATFDTKADKVRQLPGSAARAVANALHRLGYKTAVKPMSFYVQGVSGPLLAGELGRAQAWGERLWMAER